MSQKEKKKNLTLPQSGHIHQPEELSFLPASGPAQTVCLITETHSSLLCRGCRAPQAYYHVVWGLNHPRMLVCACVFVCVSERQSSVCSKETLALSPRDSTIRQRCLSLPSPNSSLSCSLSVSISLFLSGRCWFSGTKWKQLVKRPPLLETQPFVPVKRCAFEIARSIACFDACRAGRSTLRDLRVQDFHTQREPMCADVFHSGHLRVKFFFQPWDGLAVLVSRSCCQHSAGHAEHSDLVCLN